MKTLWDFIVKHEFWPFSSSLGWSFGGQVFSQLLVVTAIMRLASS